MKRLGWLGIGIGIGAIGAFVVKAILDRWPGILPGKITPHDTIVRRKAIEIASRYPGEYNINQVFEVFDYVANLNYVSDPYPNHVAWPRDTILAGGGDCDDFAVTTASLIEAIGGCARVVVINDGQVGHAFTEVYLGPRGTIKSSFLEDFRAKYGAVQIAWETDEQGEWLVFDTLLHYPGMLPQEFVSITSQGWEWLPNVRVRYVYR